MGGKSLQVRVGLLVFEADFVDEFCADDDALLREATRVFDSLYVAYGKEPDHD